MIALDISEVARRSGVAASALRYYEDKGLISSIGRRGLRRLFEPAVLQRLALIRLGRIAGFSLDEIARMFAPEGGPVLDRDMIAARADELDDGPQADRDARRPAPRGRLPRPQPHGMPQIPADIEPGDLAASGAEEAAQARQAVTWWRSVRIRTPVCPRSNSENRFGVASP